MHFGPILLHKGLDPENAGVPEARTNPNGTENASHAGVLLGSTPTGIWLLVVVSGLAVLRVSTHESRRSHSGVVWPGADTE